MNALPSLFGAVLDASGRGACLILVLLALRPVLRGRVPAWLLFGVGMAVAARLLFPVSIPARWSPFNLAPAPRAGLPAALATGCGAIFRLGD